jgi:hypothetical protein
MESSLPELLWKQRGQVRILVIDSIAGTFRSDERFTDLNAPAAGGSGGGSGGGGGAQQSSRKRPRAQAQARAEDLFKFAALLKRLSFEHDIPVVVANQASADFDRAQHVVSLDADYHLPHLKTKPALGLTWSTCVNQRLMLMRRQKLAPPPAHQYHQHHQNHQLQQNHSHQGQPHQHRQQDPGGREADLAPEAPATEWHREAALISSSHAPFAKVEFQITADGMRIRGHGSWASHLS